ncbi:MAG TPA: DinB family protein, partial [Thermoanaerobaculia bacterium]
AEAIGVKIEPSEVETIEQAERMAGEVEEQLARCLAPLTDEALAEVWSWTLPDGHTGSLPLWKMILHVANHSTHTRAQIVAAMGRAGKSPGNLDFIFYQWTGGR